MIFFNALDSYAKVYFLIAVISTTIFVIKVILMFMGADDSLDISDDSSDAFELVSIQSILAFLMGFGWIGLAARNEWGMNSILSLIVGGLFGFAMMLLVTFLMKQVKKLNKSAKFDINDCIGIIGKAYTDLKPDELGQVQVKVAGKLMIFDAINFTQEKIEFFAPIIVDKVDNNVLIVSRYGGNKE